MSQPVNAARPSEMSVPDLFPEADPQPSYRPALQTRRRRSQQREPWTRSENVGVEIRMRDTPLGAEQFRGQVSQLAAATEMRCYGATFERALRRFAFIHRQRILNAAMNQQWHHREMIEDDLIAVFDRAFRTERSVPGIHPDLSRESSERPSVGREEDL